MYDVLCAAPHIIQGEDPLRMDAIIKYLFANKKLQFITIIL